MTFGDSISTCLSKYATFQGRATRSEFWWFHLAGMLASVVAGIIDKVIFGTSNGLLGIVVSLALFLPLLAVGARRLHDIDRTGWWQLLSLSLIGVVVLIYWYVQPGKAAANAHGPAPDLSVAVEA